MGITLMHPPHHPNNNAGHPWASSTNGMIERSTLVSFCQTLGMNSTTLVTEGTDSFEGMLKQLLPPIRSSMYEKQANYTKRTLTKDYFHVELQAAAAAPTAALGWSKTFSVLVL